MGNLKVGMLPEISLVPRILHDFVNILNERGLRQSIDSYLATKEPTELANQISRQLNGSNGGYNLPLITSVVVYIGSQASPTFVKAASGNANATAVMATQSSALIFKQLFASMDAEGRYHVINAIVNQLRYPNSHTYFFMNLVHHFFSSESEDEFLQEQFTRVLLERLIVHRPHPWGLLVTFIELIKNPLYAFWRHPFTKMNPVIERVFESVSASLSHTA